MPDTGVGTLIALLLMIVASVYLGTMAQRVVRKSSFLQSYFLGNRGLGTWALALTATVQSGGTFMGFPSYVYSFGWIVALWIAGYMVVPLSGFGVLAKRMAHLSRRTGAITLPDLFRERFDHPTVGLVASLLILLFMTFMMIAQFKAGALIIKICWPGSGALDLAAADNSFDKYYYLGLVVFATTVVGYTVIGGFLAAVWTDLFQSVLMLIGVLILLPLAVQAAGGLENANRALQYEVALRPADDPSEGAAHAARRAPAETRLRELFANLEPLARSHGDRFPDRLDDHPGLSELMVDPVTGNQLSYFGNGVSLTAPGEPQRRTIVVTPADEHQWRSCLYSNGRVQSGFASEPGALLTGPGPLRGPGRPDGFLPLGLAVSFFFLWVLNGMASPAGVVRLMAAKETRTIRRSIYVLATYNTFIYLPLIVICVCGRAMLPDLPPRNSDEIVPRLAMLTTGHLPGGSAISGLILAAPFGAVMATVSSYLVVIASGLVRDIYQRFIDPQVNVHVMRRLSYIVMVVVGLIAVGANVRPVEYLQAIVVFSGSCGAAAFLTPALMAAFWRRATAAGAIAAMLGGTAAMLVLYGIGWWVNGKFSSYALLGLEPLMWGVGSSFVIGVTISLLTEPPRDSQLARCFDVEYPERDPNNALSAAEPGVVRP